MIINFIQMVDRLDKIEYFTTSLTALIDGLCSCMTTGYVGEVNSTCDDVSPNEVIIQGRIVSTPTASSTQMIDLLQSYILDQPPSIAYRNQTLAYSQRCSVILSNFGEVSCDPVVDVATTVPSSEDTATDSPSAELPYVLIGGVAGGVVALIVLLAVIVMAVIMFRKVRRGKGGQKEYSLDTYVCND